MSLQLNYNRTDTAIGGVSSLNLPLAILNYGADFVKEVDEPGEGILTNITSPVGLPERIRFAVSPVNDVYKNTGIDPTMWAPTRRGVTVLVQVQNTWTVTDTDDPKFRIAFPITGHTVLRVPQNELITADVLKAFLGRVNDGFFNSGVVTSERISSLMRGSMLPAGL